MWYLNWRVWRELEEVEFAAFILAPETVPYPLKVSWVCRVSEGEDKGDPWGLEEGDG